MFLTVMMTVCWFQYPVPPSGGPGDEDPNQKQMDLMREEAEDGAKIYAALMRKGLNADLLSELGKVFIENSKPIQARICFTQALKLDASHAAAKKGLEQSGERIEHLSKRLSMFQEKMTKKNDYQAGCSAAAILFHMGQTEQALATLSSLKSQFPGNREVYTMETTFIKGDDLRYNLMSGVAGDFAKQVKIRKLDAALSELGLLMFLSLGELPISPYLERLKKAFPDHINYDQLKSVLHFLAPEEA